MNKHIISSLIVSLFFTFHVSAMQELAQIGDPSIPDKNGICWFNRLPIKALNHIASFLMESINEFVARTKIEEIAPKSRLWFLFWDDFDGWKYIRDKSRLVGIFSPDKTKFAITLTGEKRFGSLHMERASHLLIVDLQKNDSKDKIIYKQHMKGVYGDIAPSGSGSMIAVWSYGINLLEIKKVATSQTRILFNGGGPNHIDSKWCFFRAAFNKQGTQVIMHGAYWPNGLEEYKIFPLKQSQLLIDESKTLQHYLRDKCVCNKFIENKK